MAEPSRERPDEDLAALDETLPDISFPGASGSAPAPPEGSTAKPEEEPEDSSRFPGVGSTSDLVVILPDHGRPEPDSSEELEPAIEGKTAGPGVRPGASSGARFLAIASGIVLCVAIASHYAGPAPREPGGAAAPETPRTPPVVEQRAVPPPREIESKPPSPPPEPAVAAVVSEASGPPLDLEGIIRSDPSSYRVLVNGRVLGPGEQLEVAGTSVKLLAVTFGTKRGEAHFQVGDSVVTRALR
jgi:hypothetical protein